MTENTFLTESDLPDGGSLSPGEDESGEGAPFVRVFGLGAGYLGTYLLTFIYVFFILNYRLRFRTFLLRLFADEKADEVNQIIQESADIV